MLIGGQAVARNGERTLIALTHRRAYIQGMGPPGKILTPAALDRSQRQEAQ
jgi:hypothetical protein